MALEAQNNPFTSVLMVEAADPEAIGDADPSAGSQRLVVGADHLLYLLASRTLSPPIACGMPPAILSRAPARTLLRSCPPALPARC